MVLNRRKFDLGHFDDAYHALEAALHLAEITGRDKHPRRGSDSDLRTVERVAGEQLAWIDLNAAEYHHSTASVAQRGSKTGSIWKGLVAMAHVRARILNAERLAPISTPKAAGE